MNSTPCLLLLMLFVSTPCCLRPTTFGCQRRQLIRTDTLLNPLLTLFQLLPAALFTLDIAEGALESIFCLYKQLLPQIGGYLAQAASLAAHAWSCCWQDWQHWSSRCWSSGLRWGQGYMFLAGSQCSSSFALVAEGLLLAGIFPGQGAKPWQALRSCHPEASNGCGSHCSAAVAA